MKKKLLMMMLAFMLLLVGCGNTDNKNTEGKRKTTTKFTKRARRMYQMGKVLH